MKLFQFRVFLAGQYEHFLVRAEDVATARRLVRDKLQLKDRGPVKLHGGEVHPDATGIISFHRVTTLQEGS